MSNEKEALQDTLRTPGWKIVEEKAAIMLANADRRFHQAKKEDFDNAKGFYEGVKLWHDMLTSRHMDIADVQGVSKLKQ